MTTLKTFINWHGNKSKHFNKFEKYLPDYDEYDRYIEPFVGSGAVLLHIEPEKWIINDLNKDCINCWKTVRDNPEYLIKEIKKFETKFRKMDKDDKKKYCKNIIENKLGKMSYDKKRALNYILMKSCSFAGIILRDNEFKFPHLCPSIAQRNKYHFASINKLNNIQNISNYINSTKGKIYNKDYKNILKLAKEGDFVFLDPPYIENHDYRFKYNIKQNLDVFLKELEKECDKLDKKGVLWMMTQANTKQIKQIFNSYNIKKIKSFRPGINKYINELIIMNY